MSYKFKSIKSKSFDYSMLRWALVGMTTTGIDFLLFISLYQIFQTVFLANLISTSCATLINYLTHHRWTFKSNQNHSKSGLKYVFNLIFWWIISTLIIKTLVDLDFDPKLAKIAPLIFIVPINYFVLNRLVFRKKF